ncbi:S1 RNA-binding domain-containing protein [Embleya sp. NPDC059259]|uniref:S1 RNA-binding domain-containing protein n=1 Tax=unclassified Embleya TaxID=2699296 RepID=UPI003686AB86
MAGGSERGARRAFLESLELGQVRRGVVSSIAGFGVFVDLGGFDGMVSVANLSWNHVEHLSDVVEVGEEVCVVVLDVDMDRERVSLSLQDLQPDPLVPFARTRLGHDLAGVVTKIVPFGVFVRVEGGIEGLLPRTEEERVTPDAPERVWREGDAVVVTVADINFRRRRVRFSLVEHRPGRLEAYPPPLG